jgi:hypothetical protein
MAIVIGMSKNSTNFDVFLLRDAAGALPADAILDALLAGGRIQPFASDPHRALYRNPETGAFFFLTIDPEVASLWQAQLAEERKGEDGDEGVGDGGSSVEEDYGEEEEGEDEEDEEEEEEGESFEIEAPPIAAAVPLIAPSFFFREALETLDAIASAARLRLEHIPHGEGEAEAPPAVSPDAIRSEWERARREIAEVVVAGGGSLDILFSGHGHARHEGQSVELTVWDPAKADYWWRYSSARRALAEVLEKEGVRVPPLQAALHGGRVKSLCDWRAITDIALPRTDLVLLRRERDRKGLIRIRRVLEEGLVPGNVIWDILKPHGDLRTDPVEMLVFRKSENPPQDIAARLEVLPMESLEAAQRTSLVGVIDFDPAPPAGA